ncbi:MAG: glycosyl transferase [Acidobacteria bacterium]|nr:MAG: glycosyl transferase [Acidobacteriota bacterium]PYQ19961.1 MAG: glycosyl transferase [Acidobacteriota bacterium]
MTSSPYLSVIVPAYNEARSIRSTLEAIQAHLDRQPYEYEIIVAADGDDGTREIASAMAERDRRLDVIGRPGRGGKGRGIRDGVARARGDVVGFVDADYKTPIEEMEKLVPWLDQGFDLVIGSRGVAESRVEVPQPLYRRVGSRAFGLVMHLLIGLRGIRDTQCGFKFFRGDVSRDLFSRQRIDGYMFDIEILHLALRSGYRVKEAGVRWRDDGDSRLDLVAGNWRNMLDLFRIRFGRYPRRSAPDLQIAQVSSAEKSSP